MLVRSERGQTMSAQQTNSNNSTSSTLDLIVIGGGINGAGIAADAAGRGLNVGLYEAKDLGESSKSVTFRVTLQSKEKTLEEKDLEQLHKNILEKVSSKFKAIIRS